MPALVGCPIQIHATLPWSLDPRGGNGGVPETCLLPYNFMKNLISQLLVEYNFSPCHVKILSVYKILVGYPQSHVLCWRNLTFSSNMKLFGQTNLKFYKKINNFYTITFQTLVALLHVLLFTHLLCKTLIA